MTVADAINTFALKTAAEDSPLHIKTGFFESYNGYHTVDEHRITKSKYPMA